MKYFQIYYSNKINSEIVKLKQILQETVKLHSEVLNQLKGEINGLVPTDMKINENIIFDEFDGNNDNNDNNDNDNRRNNEKENNNNDEFCSERTTDKWRTVHAGYLEFLSKSIEMSRLLLFRCICLFLNLFVYICLPVSLFVC